MRQPLGLRHSSRWPRRGLGRAGNGRHAWRPLGGGTNAGGAPSSAGTSASAGSSGHGGSITVAGAPSGGSGGASACTREALQAAAKTLAEAFTARDPMKMSLATGATYVENMKKSDWGQGIWQTALTIAFQRDFVDVDTCQSFSEIIVTEGHPYVLSVRLKLGGGKISEVEALVSDEGDWAFDAGKYLRYSKDEDWGVILEAERESREALIAAGNAYLDYFDDKTVEVPWGMPCSRLEGGQAYTGMTCNVGVPDGIKFADKRWIVDRDSGTAVGLVRFGGPNGLPDSHMFRMLKGKIRYVHTITICSPTCM